jgi:hypothetical protein
MAVGLWDGPDEVADAYRPKRTVEPVGGAAERDARRARWLEARARSERTIPELSGIAF